MAKEYIERDALIEDFKSCGADKELIDAIIFRINMNPTAYVVEVVRCKDCKYLEEAYVNAKGFLLCPASGMDITDMDFCSYGERRDDNAAD